MTTERTAASTERSSSRTSDEVDEPYPHILRAEAHSSTDGDTGALVGPDGQRIELSSDLFCLLEKVVRQVQQGKAVQIVAYDREITTQQAAEILNVSRQYLVRLLDRGEIPFTKTHGSHRRLRLQDVLDYRRQRSAIQREALGQMAREAVEAGHY